MANPFTPQDAERLREARPPKLGDVLYDGVEGMLFSPQSPPVDLARFQEPHLQEVLELGLYVQKTLNAVPAMLDLIDALREALKETYAALGPLVANGHCTVCSVGYRRYDGSIIGKCSYGRCLSHKVEPLLDGPYAEWLKQER